MPYNRDEIKKIIIKKYSKKIKRIILDKNMNGLIDEHIEKLEFIKKYGDSVDDIPTKDQIKWWFQDEPTGMTVETSSGKVEDAYEIQVDAICLKDKLASEVFKRLYKYKWKYGDKLPSGIQQLIHLTKLAEKTKNEKNKEALQSRLANIALVGFIRQYHLERSPYMAPSQISKVINFVRKALLSIDKLALNKNNGVVEGEVSVFPPFIDKNPESKNDKREA